MAHLQTHDDPTLPSLRWITLDRPDARNAWSDEMLEAFVAALDAADADTGVRVVAVTGSGSAFSAGGDLKEMRDHAGMFAGGPMELRGRYRRGIQAVPRRLARFDKPVIAAINGAAIGAGLDLTCMCDLRIASAKAKFGSTFVKVGLIPGDGGGAVLQRVVGLPATLDLVLTGRIVRADEALAMGLVHRVVEPDALREAVVALAGQIAANAPLAVQLAKSAIYRSQHLNLEDALELASTYQAISQRTADHDEGVSAILERRKPEFQGC